jgi:hypothetical protein
MAAHISDCFIEKVRSFATPAKGIDKRMLSMKLHRFAIVEVSERSQTVAMKFLQ